ncbi:MULTISPECIES: TlpA family protein disulfide reductase [Sphingobacterium]|uniref:TlpA family protein disulfide reductase n=1 Tax=Sphingobacterium TaxID=28453 RepID=UPI0013DAD74C|nr:MULTISPECIES: TlpA disulfide reductase family protein [unclassified Sphingobacterium]
MRGLLLMIIGLVLGTGIVQAQAKWVPDLSKRLYVGDTFIAPSTVQLMRGGLTRVDWKALENKVVLLEFFDTSCGSCIEAMPKLQKLRDQYPDKFEVLLVGWQDRATLEKLFSSNTYLKENKVNLPVIYADSYLKSLFPHRSVPHAVLLYRGKVEVITTTNFVTAANIERLYKEESIVLPLKDDFGSRELSDSKKNLGIKIVGYQDGVPYQGWRFEQDSLSGLIKSSLYNASMFAGLKALASKAKLQQSLYIPRMDRVVWKVRDSIRYYNFANDPYWDITYKICYERYDSIARSDSLQAQVVLKDFEAFLGVRVYKGTKRMRVLELKPAAVKAYNASKKQEAMTYMGSAVFAGFTDLSEVFPPVVDNVKSDAKMEIHPYKTLKELNAQLAAYGIKAEYGTADVEVLVIEELSEEKG